MFERFTERPRKAMNLALQEAQGLNSGFIGTGHILLGIILEGGGVAATVLKNLNVDLKRVRQEIEKLRQLLRLAHGDPGPASPLPARHAGDRAC
jgi:ATP-dependent Clp protease ATP-binding subunit ClpC